MQVVLDSLCCLGNIAFKSMSLNGKRLIGKIYRDEWQNGKRLIGKIYRDEWMQIKKCTDEWIERAKDNNLKTILRQFDSFI